MRLDQRSAGQHIGVADDTLCNWENHRAEPELRYLPALIAFVGYNPLPEAQTPGEQVKRARLSLGWSRRKLASRAGVDEATVLRVEADRKGMARRSIARIRDALGL